MPPIFLWLPEFSGGNHTPRSKWSLWMNLAWPFEPNGAILTLRLVEWIRRTSMSFWRWSCSDSWSRPALRGWFARDPREIRSAQTFDTRGWICYPSWSICRDSTWGRTWPKPEEGRTEPDWSGYLWWWQCTTPCKRTVSTIPETPLCTKKRKTHSQHKPWFFSVRN